LEGLSVDERIIFKLIFSEYDGGMDWIGLRHNRDKFRAFVNAVVIFRVT
jgi:hypothetical protein